MNKFLTGTLMVVVTISFLIAFGFRLEEEREWRKIGCERMKTPDPTTIIPKHSQAWKCADGSVHYR